MPLNELTNYISEYPKISLVVGSLIVVVAGRYKILKLLTSTPPKNNLSGYPDWNYNSPRLGTGGAGKPYTGPEDDDYFIRIAEEIRNGEH